MFGKWKEINEYSSEQEVQTFIDELMACVDLYVTYPKPRGYGGAPVINDCTSSMLCGFEALGRCGRMDIVSDILNKLIVGKDHLRGPDYPLWLSHIQKCVDKYHSSGNFVKVYKLNPRAFEVYFECEGVSPNQIIQVAEGLQVADDEVKKQFEQLAIVNKGSIYGLHEVLFRNNESGFIEDGEAENNPILKAIKNMQQDTLM